MYSVEQLINFLVAQKLTLATAESCTAGMQASMLADVPGCGSVLQTGYVVYSKESKQMCLGVSLHTIELFGLTSEEVAREMATGALKRSKAKIALANTGLAESDDALNGVVCFACAMKCQGQAVVVSETLRFEGDRNDVRRAAARYGLLRIPYWYDRLCQPRTTPEADAPVH